MQIIKVHPKSHYTFERMSRQTINSNCGSHECLDRVIYNRAKMLRRRNYFLRLRRTETVRSILRSTFLIIIIGGPNDLNETHIGHIKMIHRVESLNNKERPRIILFSMTHLLHVNNNYINIIVGIKSVSTRVPDIKNSYDRLQPLKTV